VTTSCYTSLLQALNVSILLLLSTRVADITKVT